MMYRRISHLCIAAIPLAMLASAHASAEDVIHLRGGSQVLRGDIQGMDDGGITIARTGSVSPDATRTVAWDRVRHVETDTLERRLGIYLPIADALWRARTRLERGDARLAEPGFERLYERYHGQTSETALVVAEGLLRCRIARLANGDAVVPALEVVRLRRQGITTESFQYLAPVFDDTYGLCLHVPPVLIDDGSLRRLERDLISYDPQDDAYVAALRDAYLVAARRAQGADESEEVADMTEKGLRLVQAMLRATGKEDRARQQGRRALEQLAEHAPEWAEAWIDLAFGRSLLAEEDLASHLEGMVHLAALPSRPQYRQQHHLIGIALRELAAGLRSIGDDEAASQMLALLEARYPRHPVLMTADAP